MDNNEAREILIEHLDWKRSPTEKQPPYQFEIVCQAIDCAIQALGDGSIQSEWQKCPKCDGQGIVSKPPWIAGDVYEWSDTVGQHQCNVCNGLMIIPSSPKPKQP
jgi:hypothetical protein